MSKYKANRYLVSKLEKNKLSFFIAEESNVYTLNKTATEIYQMIKKGLSQKEIAEHLSSEYNISKKQAQKDIISIIKELLKSKIILKEA